ncbi:DUF1853 family protein [Microbulbifer zhoushanensis]|uniref:DUF1853 family protein n=1 Tax=Microbulbifer zhoushanensis TaxID=2904254 RepID=UPI001F2A5CB8|nr:DUF1853 family protein [Microbulbifer zhoushanensis]
MAAEQLGVTPDHWANLAWAVGAGHIVSDFGLPWLPPSRQAELADYFGRSDVARNLAPQLETSITCDNSRGSATRLGVYFENLWAFAFQQHPDYRLLHRNLPLRAGGRTLGELDFVVHHLPSGLTEHWEIAVKFYLQVQGEFWVGPGLRDRLDIKLARMREHQLPLIRQPAARTLLADLGIQIDRQWALMPGRLFRRLGDSGTILHRAINPAACRYWWARVDEFQFHFANLPFRWALLPKRAWLADRAYRVDRAGSCAAIAAGFLQNESRGPVCVAALDHTGEASRGFIVPDNWPELARAGL